MESLAPCIDQIRQIATDLGARPYTVHSIKVEWSGGRVGSGTPKDIGSTPILPTPLVQQIGSIRREISSGGGDEHGDIVLTGISARYTEDEIDKLFGIVAEDGIERFIEVRIDGRDGTCTKRRRYVLGPAIPERRPTKVDWRVKLIKQDADRERDGRRRVPRERPFR